MNHIKWNPYQLELLDQRKLPQEKIWIICTTPEDVSNAIADMVVRGAPAIGITAAFGLVLSAQLNRDFNKDCHLLLNSRPTAVNLLWAVKRMKLLKNTKQASITMLENEAIKIFKEDIEFNRKMGDFGAELFKEKISVLTHCNAGALATGGYGTALGVIRSLHRSGKLKHVYVDETRPYLQGARLTAFELAEEDIPHTLIADNTAGYIMNQGLVDAVVTGADRIASNGDTANKIGTFMVAMSAKYHNIPFYIAAPESTFDMSLKSGKEIPIEERSSEEVTHIFGKNITHPKTRALHIGFDITPGHLIRGFITEKGVLTPPFNEIKERK